VPAVALGGLRVARLLLAELDPQQVPLKTRRRPLPAISSKQR
jgi:hypothetical protein